MEGSVYNQLCPHHYVFVLTEKEADAKRNCKYCIKLIEYVKNMKDNANQGCNITDYEFMNVEEIDGNAFPIIPSLSSLTVGSKLTKIIGEFFYLFSYSNINHPVHFTFSSSASEIELIGSSFSNCSENNNK